jgi:hypothetical protein
MEEGGMIKLQYPIIRHFFFFCSLCLLLSRGLCDQTQENVQPLIFYVSADGQGRFKTIQEAVDAAPENALIQIAPGCYREDVRITRPIRLNGAGWDKTIIAPAKVWNGTREDLSRKLEIKMSLAETEETKNAVLDDMMKIYAAPTLSVYNAGGVEISGLKISSYAPDGKGVSFSGSIVEFKNAAALVSGCVIIGSSQDGIFISGKSDVTIRDSLIAAVWGTGIQIGERSRDPVRARVVSCDIRNCHYAGIVVGSGCDAVVEKSRISGSAWHGIRYDDCSPQVLCNLIFENARCGIYASGKTSALVKGNLFYKNEISGMSCWFQNQDDIEADTFVSNRSEALGVIGASNPLVQGNIFYDHPRAVSCSYAGGDTVDAKSIGNPGVKENIFWLNRMNLSRRKQDPLILQFEEVPLDENSGNQVMDPLFSNPMGKDFSPSKNSPAFTKEIGARNLISFSSPWPLQPEEKAIIPGTDTRDSDKWIKPSYDRPLPRTSSLEESGETSPASSPPLALLFHNDPEIRTQTIMQLYQFRDTGMIDDLIRANSVEFYAPIHNSYHKALYSLTGVNDPRGSGAWKAWLDREVNAGRLKIDYLPLNIDELTSDTQKDLQPVVFKFGPEYFDEMSAAILKADDDALRYMVYNDHLPQVQRFLQSDWLKSLLSQKLQGSQINLVAYRLNGLADPGTLRERINEQVLSRLDSGNPIVLENALHLLAGVEGFTTDFKVPGAEEKIERLVENPNTRVAIQAVRAIKKINPGFFYDKVRYLEAFQDLYELLEREYPCFELKGIDWKKVGEALLPRVNEIKSKEDFGLLCIELVARLEDSHAYLLDGSVKVPSPPFPKWDPGFACLFDDRAKPVVYYLDKDGPAEKAGVTIGMTVISINGIPSNQAIEDFMIQTGKYTGYSSDRYLRYHAARWFIRQMDEGTTISLDMQNPDGAIQSFQLPAALGVRYLPRLPVPVKDISDTKDVSWTMLPGDIGYIYVRRIGNKLIENLDDAVRGLHNARGIVIDVRGNSGGGFDANRSFRNFDLEDKEEPERPRFKGPVALLIDARCISAGEGWASWFIAKGRARVFGEATAGASARKKTYTMKNGMFKVQYPDKAYHGFLSRPIERRGLEPDVPLMQNARDLAQGRDTVLEAAKKHLLEK